MSAQRLILRTLKEGFIFIFSLSHISTSHISSKWSFKYANCRQVMFRSLPRLHEIQQLDLFLTKWKSATSLLNRLLRILSSIYSSWLWWSPWISNPGSRLIIKEGRGGLVNIYVAMCNRAVWSLTSLQQHLSQRPCFCTGWTGHWVYLGKPVGLHRLIEKTYPHCVKHYIFYKIKNI